MWTLLDRWFFPVVCLQCGQPGSGWCDRCRTGVAAPRIIAADGLNVRAATTYEGHVRSAIRAMKRGERAYLAPLAELLEPLVARGATTILVPVATSAHRRRERGFDQAQELAARLASLTGARVVDALRKRGRAQHGRNRARRLAASGRFSVQHAQMQQRVTLVDDVMTTGATLRDAASTLRAAGWSVRDAIVVAYAEGETAPRSDRFGRG